MNKIIEVIGIFILLYGIVIFLYPDLLKKLMVFFKKDSRVYFVAIFRFILAFVFLLSARECYYPMVIIVFGVIFILSGLLIFFLGAKWLSSMFDWYLQRGLLLFRIIGLIVLTVGGVIIYSA